MPSENDNQIDNKGQKNNDEQASANRSADRVGKLNMSRRQAKIAQDQAAEQKRQKEEKEKKDAKPNAVSNGTSKLLKGAWQNLIDSWGFTLIWIDIHVFGNLVFGDKVFCKLGMEWVPDSIKRAQFKEAEKLGKVAGTIEGSGVACLNLGCLVTVLGILVILGMMLDVLKNPLVGLSHIAGYVWDAVSNAVIKWVSGG